MMLLVLTEDDGVSTRISVGVDAIAREMAGFFAIEVGLDVECGRIDEPVKIDDRETFRANYFMKEWRENDSPVMVVK